MSDQSELFDIVESDFHWLAGGSVMKASRFEGCASENVVAAEKLLSIPEEVGAICAAKCSENVLHLKRNGHQRRAGERNA